MNIEDIIKQEAVKLKSSGRDIDIAPDLNPELVAKWKKKYSKELKEDISDYILVMSYTSTGSFALTGNAFYYDNYLQNGIKCIKYEDIVGANAKTGGLFAVDKLYLKTTYDEELKLDGCIDGIDINKFAQILLYIVKKKQESGKEFSISKQGVMSYELPDELKVLYLKILCNYSYINDGLIDINEYNAIGKFSVRMELGSEARTELRKYMNSIDKREKTGNLINKANALFADDSGQRDALRYCLMQDVIYIHNIQNRDKAWTEDGFIGSLMDAYDLHPAQIDTMMAAVRLNERMQNKDADIKSLKKEWNELTKRIRYSTGYVPSAYLFCSGSIYGIDSYNNFLKKEDVSEKAISKYRELIMQEIIINNQKTMNVLIDDMNYLAEQLETAVNESNENKERYRKLIQRLQSANQALKQDTELKKTEQGDEG